jgi:mRNA interferase HigB
MRVISKKRLRNFWEKNSQNAPAKEPLSVWYKAAKRAMWKNFAEIRAVYASADQVGKYTVFNIGGNKYRLIAEIIFPYGRVYIRRVMTHKEYDENNWK